MPSCNLQHFEVKKYYEKAVSARTHMRVRIAKLPFVGYAYPKMWRCSCRENIEKRENSTDTIMINMRTIQRYEICELSPFE